MCNQFSLENRALLHKILPYPSMANFTTRILIRSQNFQNMTLPISAQCAFVPFFCLDRKSATSKKRFSLKIKNSCRHSYNRAISPHWPWYLGYEAGLFFINLTENFFAENEKVEFKKINCLVLEEVQRWVSIIY